MDANLIPPTVRLCGGAVRSYAGHRGGGIAVVEGQVWLTQPNDLRDHVLQPGESFAFDGHGRVVIQALGDASVLLLDKVEEASADNHGRR